MRIPARFIQEIGTQYHLVRIWPSEGRCVPGHSHHRASKLVGETASVTEDRFDELCATDHPPHHIPTHCERCNAPVPVDNHSRPTLASSRKYNTESGKPEPGDIYYVDWYSCTERSKCIYGWTNCDGKHLYAILPDGSHWDMDSRAKNCTMKEDTTHRCWVRHGEVPLIHVDKNGHTCAAGAGSIDTGSWHGFLEHGVFVKC